MGNLLWVAIFGLIAGAIAKAIMPGKDPGGIVVTMLIGIGGSFLGSMIGGLLGFESAGSNKLFSMGLVFAVIGAVLILFVWKKYIAPKFFNGNDNLPQV